MNRYEALKHATIAHAGQVDKCGRPYILHPIAVAQAVEYNSPLSSEVVALLHDVWEDTDYNDHNGWLTGSQQAALEAITRSEGETYADYIERVCENEIASVVKLADLWHNLQPERQGCLPASEGKGLEKRYLKARDRIWEALGYEWWPRSDREGG